MGRSLESLPGQHSNSVSKKITSGTGEMAQWEKCLPHKCENLSSDIQNPLSPTSCPLTFTHTVACACVYTHTLHKYRNVKKLVIH